MRAPPAAVRILPIVVVIGAVALAAANFATIFELTPPGAEPLEELSGVDRHSYALVILAVFALAALFVAISSRSRPAAIAVAVCGGVALLLFLLRDLREAGTVGLIADPVLYRATTEADPQFGFWLEAIGSVAMALGGIGFASLFRPGEESESRATERG